MAPSFERRLLWLAVGIAELLRFPRIRRELIVDSARRAIEQLGPERVAELAGELEEVVAASRVAWADELADGRRPISSLDRRVRTQI